MAGTAAALARCVQHFSFGGQGWLPGAAVLSPDEAHSDILKSVRSQFGAATGVASLMAFDLLAPQLLTVVLTFLTRASTSELERLTYLGPLRCFPARHFMVNPTRDTNWAAGGGLAWERLRDEPGVSERVNWWLSDSSRLHTPFELSVRRLVSDDELRRRRERA